MGNVTNDIPTYGNYIKVCKEAIINDSVFNEFKKTPAYTYVLEHTTKGFGHEYIRMMAEQHKERALLLDWNKLKENDFFGGSTIEEYEELRELFGIEDCGFSPSTINYIYRGLDIIESVLSKNETLNILEIGGGYGGQCKVLLDMCEMLGIKINTYGIVDLEYASKLQRRYLGLFNYPNVEFFEYENIESFEPFEKFNTVISMYALTEFDINVQNYYIDNFIKGKNHYYILCNNPMNQEIFHNDEKVKFVRSPDIHWPINNFFCEIIYK